MAATVDIGGLVIPSNAVNGFGFNGLGDWYTLSSSKTDLTERSLADGAFGASFDWRSQLALTLAVYFVAPAGAPARSVVQAAKDQLKRATGTGRPVTVGVTDDDGRRWRTVSVRKVTIDDDHGRPAFTATLDLVAPDAFLYGETTGADLFVREAGTGLLFPLGTNPDAYWDFGTDAGANRTRVDNPGSAPSWPVVTMFGPASGGFIVTNVTTGESVQFVRPVSAAEQVQIDMRTGTATLGGTADVSAYVTSFGFFSIPADGTAVIDFQPLGTTGATTRLHIDYSQTWL